MKRILKIFLVIVFVLSVLPQAFISGQEVEATVSYTHLTLPTILRV